MRDVRKEVADLTRCCDILLNSDEMQAPLTDREQELLAAYLTRVRQKLKVSGATPTESTQTLEGPMPLRAHERTALKSSA